MELQGQWLPVAESAAPSTLLLRDLCRHLEAARLASTAHHKLNYLNEAQNLLNRFPDTLARESDKFRRAAFSVMPAIWQKVLDEQFKQARAEAADSVPNPFLTQPLNPESGSELFLGRDELIRALEELMADPKQRVSMALLGPRRCGKSSLLKMLPLKLPDAVPVFFDLQDNSASTPQQFFANVARRVAEQARRERELTVPPLPAGADIDEFSRWLEQLDDALGQRRLLLCIDEFERLPDLYPGDRRALLQLMGLLRATVQNRRNIRLLVAGVAPFDELDAIWSDHFINLRELRVEHLPADAALQLLTRPIPDFNAIPEDVARRVMARTGCQPLLLQLYGGMLVNRLNADKRTTATLADAQAVDDAVLEQGNAVNHFRNLYDSAPPEAQAALRALAHGQTPELRTPTRRYLQRRCLIDASGQPVIPVFMDWVQMEHGE